VLNEMQVMYQKYSIRDFVLSDDNFIVDIDRAYRIAEMIEKRTGRT